MSTVVINLKSRKLKHGDTIPHFKDSSQKRIEVENDDTIKWKYDNDSEIIIDADLIFNNESKSKQARGKGKAETIVNGATFGQEKVISYNVTTSDTDVVLDPLIIIKKPDFIMPLLKNPMYSLIVGIAIGVFVSYLF